jgi:Bacterial Ig-like domain (group 3)
VFAPAKKNNFARWPMLGIEVWPNPQAAGTYDGEVAYLTNWLTLRVAYLDSQFNGKSATSTSLDTPGGTLQNGSPATLVAHVLPLGVGGTVSFTAASVLLGNAPVDGTGTATLTTSNVPSGSVSLQAVYSGNGNAALSASNLVSVTVLPAPATGNVNKKIKGSR